MASYVFSISSYSKREIGAFLLLNIDEDNLILDAGFNESEDIEATIERLRNIVPKPIAILISHAHVDHVGFLPLLHDIFPEAEILMTPLTRKLAKIMLSDSFKHSEQLKEKTLEVHRFEKGGRWSKEAKPPAG